MVDRVECIVIGAGVIGLAIARALALAGREVIVLEAQSSIGTETSSRNSEVIHAGIYYPPDSLKARFCVPGRKALYDYCEDRGIGHARLGKLIVATTEDQLPLLDELRAAGTANGVDDLEMLDARGARVLEPRLVCAGALLSPSTGIIDSHALMLSYQGEAEAHGATIAFLSPVLDVEVADHGFRLRVSQKNGGPVTLACAILINAAGLRAPDVARTVVGVPSATVPRYRLVKGNYFNLRGRSPFSRLIYPVPDAGSLGIHLTLDLAGQARFGPDQEPVDAIDYDVDPGRAAAFYDAIRRYYPDLADDSLLPSYAGIRPKVALPGGGTSDFMITKKADHGVPGLVNLFGIESPGLTAALAIADYVAAELDGSRAKPGPIRMTTACAEGNH